MNRLDVLIGTLDRSVRDRLTGPEAGVLFSGGVDSCVVASLASRHVVLELYTVGVEGAHDLRVGEASANAMGLNWTGIKISVADIEEAVGPVAEAIATDNPLVLSFEMPLYFVAKAAREGTLICGQGADEIFGGYARYGRMGPEERRRAMWADTEELIVKGAPAERRMAARYHKELAHPYLDPEVVEVARSLPDEMIVKGDVRKLALRQVATALGLDAAAARPKKAAQYGSGIMRTMKQLAKRQGLPLKEWTARMVEEGSR